MPEYELFCLIEINEKVSKPFSIEIAGDESVHKLKERIKDKKQNNLKDVDTYRLMLWKVDTPDDQDIDSSGLASEDELKPTQRINRYWKVTPLVEHIHIFVRVPDGRYPS